MGIGTTSPKCKLDVAGAVNVSDNMTIAGLCQFNNNAYFSGSIGVGTVAPNCKLHVLVGESLGSPRGSYNRLTRLENNGGGNSIFINDFMYRENDGNDWLSASYLRGVSVDVSFLEPNTLRSWIKQNPFTEKIEFGSSGKTYMSVGENVRIGSENSDGNLQVKGSITAKEVTVKDPVWADYVFDKNYKLRDLKEVDQFIQENGHLPEIPSTAEVKEKGVNLVEVQAKLLQKVEELTLYVIKLEREMKQLKSKNKIRKL